MSADRCSRRRDQRSRRWRWCAASARSTALDGLAFEVARGRALRAGRAGRRRQDHRHPRARRAHRRSTPARRACSGWTRVDGRAVRERLGLMPQQYSLYRDLSVDENLRFFARLYVPAARGLPRARRAAARASRGSRASSTAAPTRSPAACTRSWRSPARSCTSPRCCSSTSRPTASTRCRRRELWELLHEFVARRDGRAGLDAVHGRGRALPPGRARPPRAAARSRASRGALIAALRGRGVRGARRRPRRGGRGCSPGAARCAPPRRPARGCASWWRAAARTSVAAARWRRSARALAPAHAGLRGPVPRAHRGRRA